MVSSRYELQTALFVAAFGLGCTEFDVSSIAENDKPRDVEVDTADPAPVDTGETEPPVEGTPIALISHDRVDFGIVCSDRMETVTVESVGDAPLTVSWVQVDGLGWELSHGSLPALLAPGEGFEIHLLGGTSGEGMLTITTDQDGETRHEIPLVATADRAPTLTITRPVPESILSPEGDATFEAIVTDDRDRPEALSVSWTSSVDGALGTVTPATDGMVVLPWRSVAQSSGDHRVEATVTDSCGNVAIDSVGFCQNEGYTEDSIDLETWNFEGSALWDMTNEWVELTGPFNDQAGTAFQTAAAVSSDDVVIDFEFYVSGGSGADGISLTALDVDRMSSFVGGTGGGIGYYGLPGWSIEVDTWYNSEHSDPTSEDHLSFHIDGDINTPLAWATLPDMEDGAWHTASVSVIGPHVTVAIDGTTYIDTDIGGLVPFSAYVGFTAATGGATNYHLIDALSVEGFVCDD